MLVGTTLSYRPDGQGFFVIPADPRANNLRVFVVTSAVRHVRFLGANHERVTATVCRNQEGSRCGAGFRPPHRPA